jgi:hypothetical protein
MGGVTLESRRSRLSNPQPRSTRDLNLTYVLVGATDATILPYVASVLIADDVAPAGLRATAQSLAKAVSGGLAPTLGALGGGFVYGVIGRAQCS